MLAVTQVYEVLSRLDSNGDGSPNARWGRGSSPWAMSIYLGVSHKTAVKILEQFLLHNFVWKSVRPFGVNRNRSTYYLNEFGRAMLDVYRYAADAPPNTGQPVLMEVIA